MPTLFFSTTGVKVFIVSLIATAAFFIPSETFVIMLFNEKSKEVLFLAVFFL